MDDLWARRSIFITGCGGVGKTFSISAVVCGSGVSRSEEAQAVLLLLLLLLLLGWCNSGGWFIKYGCSVCVHRLDSLQGHSAHLPRRSKSSSGC